MTFSHYFLGFFKAKNHAYLSIEQQKNLTKTNVVGDEVFDKEQAEFDLDIQNPFIKDESIEFPKADIENVIENNDYINATDNWSVLNPAQRDLGNLYSFNWASYTARENSIIYQ